MEQGEGRGALRRLPHRSDRQTQVIDAVKVTRWEDDNLLAGMPYRYQIRAYGAAGQGGCRSDTVSVDLPLPEFSAER